MQAAVDLYWIPLGAGGHCVRHNGRVYEALIAARERRVRRDLYHAALEVRSGGTRYAIEVTPTPDSAGARRGVVASGPVGSRWLGWWKLFRYEVRCWPDGTIPDLDFAVCGQRLSSDPAVARRLLARTGQVPALVWGRDEAGAGEMWNSNSVAAWMIVSAGLAADAVRMPTRGGAPGWRAGLAMASREVEVDQAQVPLLVGLEGEDQGRVEDPV
jgi:hypothetical protein